MPGAVVSNRVEAYTRGTDLRPGLEARVHDALWLLARQRQLGEFDGLDAGTPVSAALVVRAVPLASWQPAGGKAAGYSAVAPLEMLVESDGQPLPWRDVVAGGLRLATDLRRAGLDPAVLIKTHPLQVPAANGVTPDEVAATSAVMAGRVLDPAAVAAAFAKGADTVVTAAGGEAARPVLASWNTWWQSRSPRRAGAWQPAELSYALSVSTQDASLPTYHADRFGGGSLDWHVFDVASGTAATSAAPPPAPTRAVPVPVGFHGAPVGRYWQLDDARTDLGAIETYPTELAKLLLAEFTACFSGDWFRLPVRVPYGSAARVEALVSTDTFGVSTLVPAAASGTGPWRMYEHTAIDGAADGSWLLVPPVLAGSMDSDPVEEVAFARDPAADLAWGIELVVTNAVGRPIRRSDDLAAQGRFPPPTRARDCPTRGCGASRPPSRRTGSRCSPPAAANPRTTISSCRASCSATSARPMGVSPPSRSRLSARCSQACARSSSRRSRARGSPTAGSGGCPADSTESASSGGRERAPSGTERRAAASHTTACTRRATTPPPSASSMG